MTEKIITNEQVENVTRDLGTSEGNAYSGNLNVLRQLIRDSLIRRRQALVYTLAKKFYEVSDGLDGTSDPVNMETVADGDWMPIESLSQLRAIVGGRFQNLKHKWVKAGFPLREHRGDREQKAEVDASGWVELSMWISKQGYETRRGGDNDSWLFEIRKV